MGFFILLLDNTGLEVKGVSSRERLWIWTLALQIASCVTSFKLFHPVAFKLSTETHSSGVLQ